MAIALVANTMKTGNSTSSAIDTTGANLLVVSIGSVFSATLSDSKGNTWTALTTYGSSFGSIKLMYCSNPTVGSGHTFTIASGTLTRMCAAAFSGVKATSPFDQQSGASSSAVTTQPGSVTPSEDNELLITAGSEYVTAAPTINSSFVFSNKDAYGTDSGVTGGMAYKIQTAAGAENPTWTWASGAYSKGVTIATFKAEPAGGLSIPVAMAQYRQRRN